MTSAIARRTAYSDEEEDNVDASTLMEEERAALALEERARLERNARLGQIKSAADKEALMRNPAVQRSGWIPRGLRPELDELGERHEAALTAVEEALRAAGELGQRFKDEDEARIEAYKTGLKTPKMTPPDERER